MIEWRVRQKFIIDKFLLASENSWCRDTWIVADAWIQYIRHNYCVPDAYKFDASDLNRAIRTDKRLKVGLDNTGQVPNEHGVYRDYHSVKLLDGKKPRLCYYQVVNPGMVRQDPKHGAWHNSALLQAPVPPRRSPRNDIDDPGMPPKNALAPKRRSR